MYKTLFIILLLAAGLTLDASAQRKAGRNGGAFLEIGIGAREVGLGSAVSSLTNDANQIFWNPAGTALRDNQTFSAAFSYNDWIADLSYTAAAAGYNLGSTGTVTVGVQVFGVSDIPANRENGYSDPILQGLVTDNETSATFNYTDLAVSVSYARYFFDRLSLGATFKVINESIDSESASAVAFDFGSVYSIGFSGWQIAARLSNLGSPITFYNQDNPLPLTFSIGTSIYPVNTERTRVMLALDTIKPQDSQQLIFGGAEVSLYDLLFLRGGYKFNYSGKDDDGTSGRDPIATSIEGMSLGGGIQYEISGFGVGIDYAFTQMDLLDNVHRLTLRIGN
ncbi:MAG TPA: PorV/PorQ family protein [Rhodothermales bacterium]|nr:PorV/PorQ family protein [Rhodothermales bacterium]